jgi:acetate---CoA ligase (ADP-forming)
VLARFLNPQSIALVGGRECAIAIKRTLEFGFTGKIWAVHPSREELGGILTVKSVADIQGPIDAAFVAVKREPTIEVVRQLRAKNCGGAVIYAAGFAEAGAANLQADMLKAADGMPLMGPNCYGFVNGLSRVALWPDEHGIKVRDTGVAILTQSGNIACNLTFTRRELPLAAIFTLGNQADVDLARMVQALVQDPRITAIGMHVEGVKDIHAFSIALAEAHGNKPIVVLKTGRSEKGAKVALSHTASLSGADQLYDALFTRYGVARVSSVTALAETLKLLHHGGPLKGAHLVSHSCSGGEAALIADMAVGRNVSFPPFDEATKPKIRASLNEFVSLENPFDYHTFIWGDGEKLQATFTASLSGGFDCGILILDTPNLPHMNSAAWYVTSRAWIAAARANGARAVVVASMPESVPDQMAAELAEAGIAPMHGLDDCLTALEAAAMIGENWSRDEEWAVVAPVNELNGKSSLLTEHAGKRLLGKYGLSAPKGKTSKPADAPKIAAALGFPVALKISSDSIAHKTEAGGVHLNLSSKAEVKSVAAKLTKLGSEVLVEKMVEGAVAELILGVKRDPQFGLSLVVGAGGILAELLRDTATLILPATRLEIVRALKSLRVWKLIEGFRGRRGDQEAVIKAVEAVARFAADHAHELEELDVNPLFVLAKGAIAGDALIRMRYP